jgi:hypothetical protein
VSGLELVANVAWVIGVTLSFGYFIVSILEDSGRIKTRIANRVGNVIAVPIGVSMLVNAMWQAYVHNWLRFTINCVVATIWLYAWWNRNGKKLAARIITRVRAAGHRLVVVPVKS